jgi:hypothetical protein
MDPMLSHVVPYLRLRGTSWYMWDSRDLSHGGVPPRAWDHVHCGVASSIGPYVSTSWMATLRSFFLHNFVVSSFQVRNREKQLIDCLGWCSLLPDTGPLLSSYLSLLLSLLTLIGIGVFMHIPCATAHYKIINRNLSYRK